MEVGESSFEQTRLLKASGLIFYDQINTQGADGVFVARRFVY